MVETRWRYLLRAFTPFGEPSSSLCNASTPELSGEIDKAAPRRHRMTARGDIDKHRSSHGTPIAAGLHGDAFPRDPAEDPRLRHVALGWQRLCRAGTPDRKTGVPRS